MKAQTVGRVEIEFDMVHPVQAATADRRTAASLWSDRHPQGVPNGVKKLGRRRW